MPSILVVDDEDHVRQLVRIILERAGYAVREAPDGQAALTLYRESPPDVVVTDLMMKPMGGLELMGHLRRESPKVKIIVMSGFNDGLFDAHLLGAGKILAKPFSIDEMSAAVQDLLDRSE
jgi:two-component system response regulator (stage 0 sporulation protein F)